METLNPTLVFILVLSILIILVLVATIFFSIKEVVNKPITINLKSLIDKIEIKSSEDIEELQSKVKEALLSVLDSAKGVVPGNKAFYGINRTNERLHCLKIEDNELTCANGCAEFCYLKKLEYHKATTVGLWCFDRNPKEVDLAWIRTHAFRLSFCKDL